MKQRSLIRNPFLVLAVLFILSVSVAPAMAANAVNKDTNSFSASSTGMGSLSSNVGGENKNILNHANFRGVSAGSSVANLGTKSESDGSVNKEVKSQKTPWYKLWWVWYIVALVLIVAITVTVLTCGVGAAEIVPVLAAITPAATL